MSEPVILTLTTGPEMREPGRFRLSVRSGVFFFPDTLVLVEPVTPPDDLCITDVIVETQSQLSDRKAEEGITSAALAERRAVTFKDCVRPGQTIYVEGVWQRPRRLVFEVHGRRITLNEALLTALDHQASAFTVLQRATTSLRIVADVAAAEHHTAAGWAFEAVEEIRIADAALQQSFKALSAVMQVDRRAPARAD